MPISHGKWRTTIPWPLPRHHHRDRLLPNVLPLVQHRTSPWRDRDAHPGRRASQSNPERAGAARADPSSRLDPSSRTLRSRDPTTGSPSPSRLDQPTCDTHNRRNCSVNRNRHCLKVVDRFRWRRSRSWSMSGRGRTGSWQTRNCYQGVTERTDGMLEKRETARAAFSGHRAKAAGWPTISTDGARCRLDMEAVRLLCDDGRMLPWRPTAGNIQRDRRVEGWTATGQDAGSHMRQ